MDASYATPIEFSAYVAPYPFDQEYFERNGNGVSLLDCLTEPVQFHTIEDLEMRINSFLALQDNWDGYGAAAPEEATITNAIKFIQSLPTSIIENVEEDEINASPYGTLVVDFRNSKEELVSVEIGKNQIGFFSELESGKDLSSNGIIFNENNLPEALIVALKELFRYEKIA
jgi:hypothetical protein